MPATQTETTTACAAEVFGAIVASAESDPYPPYAELPERPEPVRRGGAARRGFDRLPVTVA